MAAKEVKYHILDENELFKHAKKSREIEDLEQRLDIGHKILTGYLTSPQVGMGYLEKSINISLGEMPKELFKKFKEQAAKGKKVGYHDQMDFFKKMADAIMPKLVNTKDGDTENNYKHMEMYLGHKDKNGITIQQKVMNYLANGNAEAAKTVIVDAIISYHKQRDQDNLLSELITPDDYDLHKKLAEKFAKKYNNELKESGIDKKVSVGEVEKNIHSHYLERAQHATQLKNEYAKHKGGEE